VTQAALDLAQRELGRRRGATAGATVAVVVGMHGNEPAGVLAAQRVLEALGETPLERGQLVVLAGHLQGLRAGQRFVARDLNRQWTPALLSAAQARIAQGVGDAEDHELVELHATLDTVVVAAEGEVYLTDLHTTSAPGLPFVIFGDTPAQRDFVRAFPIPVIRGLEAQIPGVMTAYWAERGCVTCAVEGGQSQDPGALDNLEAIIWLSLRRAALLGDAHGERTRAAEALLDARRADLPRVLQVTDRRAITADDAFVMAPGFRNLDHARAGQLLAHDRNGPIHAPEDGVVILPLYQKLGSDGYFWGRAVADDALAEPT